MAAVVAEKRACLTSSDGNIGIIQFHYLFQVLGFEPVFQSKQLQQMAQEPIQDLMWTFFDRSLAVAKAAGVQTDRWLYWILIGSALDQERTYYYNLGRFTKVSFLGPRQNALWVNIIEADLSIASCNGDRFLDRDLAGLFGQYCSQSRSRSGCGA